MPYYPEEIETPDFEAKADRPVATAKDTEFATQYNEGLGRSGSATAVTTVLGSAIDLADTVISSVTPGVERQDVNNTFLNAIGSPGLTGWVDKNRGSLEVGSSIAGVILSDVIAGRLLKPASPVMKAIRAVPYARRVATLDAEYERAVRVARLANVETARRGMLGVERFAGETMTLSALGAKPFAITSGRAANNVFKAQAAKGLARNVATEAVMGTLLHTNSVLYSDELSHNLAWGVGGLAVGGVLDSMVSAYTLRKMANSDEIRRLNARAFDTNGLEANRVHSASIVSDLLHSAYGMPSDPGFLMGDGSVITDKITSMALGAASLRKRTGIGERAAAIFGKRERMATPTIAIAFEELNKVTTRGLTGVSNAGFGTHLEGLGMPLKSTLEVEPGALYGISEVGTTVDNLNRRQTALLRDSRVSQRLTQVNQLLADGGKMRRTKNGSGFVDTFHPLKPEEHSALVEEATLLRYKASHVPVTMLEVGEWAPIEFGAIADNYRPRELLIEGGLGEDNLKVWQRKKEQGEQTLGLSSDGEVFLPEGKRLDNLSIEDSLTLYQIGNKAVRDMAAANHTLRLPQNPSWFQLDLAEQLLKQSNNPASVQFPGAMTRESAIVESFAQKVDAIKRKGQAIRMAQRQGMAESIDEIKLFEMKVQFNLPRLTSYEQGLMGTSETPLDLLMSGMKSSQQVRDMTHAELLEMVNDAKRITGFTDGTRDTFDSLQGNSFNFLMDANGNPIKPIVAYKRPLAPMEWSRDELFVRQAMKESHVQLTLMGESADPITREMVQMITSNPNFSQARKIMELADDQSRSFVPGFRNSAPQTTTGSLISSLTSKERRDVDSMTMLSASRIKEESVRITNAIMKETIQGTMGDVITLVNSPRNLKTKLLLNQFHTFRQGWDLRREPTKVPLPDGSTGYQFVLDEKSTKNQARFQSTHGREFGKGQVLLNPNGTEVVLDQLGLATQTRLQQLHEMEVAMKNTLLRSQNLREISVTPWYVPPPPTKGKFIGYVFDSRNEIVPDMTVYANSAEELTRLGSEMKDSQNWKFGYIFRQRDEAISYMTLWDKAQMDFIAPNTTAIQPGKHNFGKSGGNLLNPRAFDDSLVTIRDNLVKHGSDVLDVLFDEPLKSARVRAQVAKVKSGVGEKAVEHSSIYDRYIENITGRNSLHAKGSFFGTFFEASEQRLNGLLNSPAAIKAGDMYGVVTDFLRTADPRKPLAGDKFTRLSKELGKFMPFESAMELAARETGTHTPRDIAGITSKLSWFEAASRLRWFESMMAVSNVGGILANTPAVIRALQPMAGETLAEAAARNGSMAMMAATREGKEYGILHSNKLLYHAMRDMWKQTPELAARRAKATRLGMMDQEVAEFQRSWGAIDSKNGWRGFVFGSEVSVYPSKTGFGVRNKVAKSGGIDKWISIVTDKSEAFTRQWAMHVGFRVADTIGIHDADHAVAFAHDLTNKIIANYDPRNRPEVFQGALGAPLGLFQSYVMNFYQRMFRYIETGNGRAIATQYAMQSAVFGVQSVPGWNQLNWAFFDHQQAENEDPVDSLYKRLGTPLGDLVMHGTISNLPKLFGLDGTAVYTRGDAQFRAPVNPAAGITGGNFANLPVLDTVSRLYKGIQEGVGEITSGRGLSLNHTAEILSNMITNRPLAGAIEVFGAHGYDTTWDGQVASQAKGLSESLYRILGTRAMQKQKETELFYANKNAMEEQAARKTALRTATRAAIRDGRTGELPQLFQQYVANGGSPNYYTRWLKESYSSALDTRGERQISKAMKDEDGSKDALIGRLLDSQVDINTDDTASSDYGREAEIEELAKQRFETAPDPTATLTPEE